MLRAALDVGSGRTKMDVMRVADGRIVETLLSRHDYVPFAHDYARNQHKQLSDEIQRQGLEALKVFKSLAESLGCTAMGGVATHVFRKAQNGPDYLRRVGDELGIRLQLVPQATEGQLGYLTALAGLGDRRPQNLIAYDSGAASFQVTFVPGSLNGKPVDASCLGHLQVYEGPCGTIPSLQCLVETVRGQSVKDVKTPNPVTRAEVERLAAAMQGILPPVPPELVQLLQASDTVVVGVGEETSEFAVAARFIGRNDFDQAAVEQALDKVCDKTDEHFQQLNEPEHTLIVPKMGLLLACMRHMGMKRILYAPTNGCCPGVALLEELWQA